MYIFNSLNKCILVSAAIAPTLAFIPTARVSNGVANPLVLSKAHSSTHAKLSMSHFDMEHLEIESKTSVDSIEKDNSKLDFGNIAMLTTIATMAMPVQDALAKGGQYGILEGRSAALIHPITMAGMFLLSLYTAVLGFNYRRSRTIGAEITELKATLPKLSDGSAISVADLSGSISKFQAEVDSASSAEGDVDQSRISSLKADIATLQSASVKEIAQQVSDLTATRKDLSKQNLRDRHYDSGSVLLGTGVTVAIAGCFDTYFRAGKLFPGPHLYAGAGTVVLWAIAASLVPKMQKGSETARSIHIAANVLNIALFAWQVNTGWGILLKVIEFTKWP